MCNMNFYCQLDYKHISYPSPSSVNGNIADNGCGVCCTSMVVEALCDTVFPIEASAKFAKNVKNQLEKSGCRILGAILNNIEEKSNGYYYSKYYYQRYYHSYYGKYGKYGYGAYGHSDESSKKK